MRDFSPPRWLLNLVHVVTVEINVKMFTLHRALSYGREDGEFGVVGLYFVEAGDWTLQWAGDWA